MAWLQPQSCVDFPLPAHAYSLQPLHCVGSAGSIGLAAKRMEVESYLELTKAGLTEAEFQTELAAGRAMSLEQAVDYAQNLLLKQEIAPASEETPDSLTGREREIAALIGQGKTNDEIAVELVLNKRTVETHVSRILSKLGLSSRSQVIRWAIDHRMDLM